MNETTFFVQTQVEKTNTDSQVHEANKEDTSAIKQHKRTSKRSIKMNLGGIEIPVKAIVKGTDTIAILLDSVRSLNTEILLLKKRAQSLEGRELQRLEEQGRRQKEKYQTPDSVPASPNPIVGYLLVFVVLSILLLLITKRGKSFLSLKKEQPQILYPKTARVELSQQSVQKPVADLGFTRLINVPKSYSNISRMSGSKSGVKDWFIVAASAVGKSHITSNKPCQDNHSCTAIGNGWGIAVACDGAGSAEHSELGSEFVTKEATKIFKNFINKNNYREFNSLPSDEEWRLFVFEAFELICIALETFAEFKKMKLTSLACTIIVVIYSPKGLLVAHLGDGRAGYCNEKGKWMPTITPHKGEEANETIFISSTAWRNGANLTMSGVPVPESRVIRERPVAFTLMSDGCETHSYECSKMDIEKNSWHDPNVPSPKFFNSLVDNLRVMNQNNIPEEDANRKWRAFLEEGTPGLKEESDDKTLILGILI